MRYSYEFKMKCIKIYHEGIVNSLTHRDYSIMGDYIRVSLYDDRLEIFSPGRLPNIVTLDSMLNTSYLRNVNVN